MSVTWFGSRLTLILGMAFFCVVSLLVAEDQPASPAPAATKAKDSFKVPQDASPAQLLKFSEDLFAAEPSFETRAELFAYYKQVSAAVIEATNLLFNTPDLQEKQIIQGLTLQFQALNFQVQLEVKGAAQQAYQLALKFSQHEIAGVAEFATERLLITRAYIVKDLDAAAQQKLVDDILAKAKQLKSSKKALNLGSQFADLIEENGAIEIAAQINERIGKLLEKDPSETVVIGAKTMIGAARRLRLPGKPFDIDGNLLNGEAFDWSSYKGKVILVDYWATWCPTCVEELPNVARNYKKYHAQGFEVIGVSLDESKAELTSFLSENKLPWPILFHETDGFKAEPPPAAIKYGVTMLPCTILVGRDGNVVSMDLMGEKLDEELAKLFPKTPVKPASVPATK